jgi:hypothetical protein
MDLDGPKESLEAKQPPIDNGLDVVHPSRYTSREFMEREWQHLWPRVWLLAGVVSDIPQPGDYFTYDHGHESFVVVRQQDMGIKAFYNVCPHRGNRIALTASRALFMAGILRLTASSLKSQRRTRSIPSSLLIGPGSTRSVVT